MPRAATSVATSTGSFPLEKSARARSRAPCRRSPWMAPARTPSRRSWLTRRSAPRLVRTKTSVRSTPLLMAAATFTLSIWCTCRNRCAISSTVASGCDLVLDGIVHVAVDELSHAAVEGGREQHRLMLGLDAVQQLLHLGHEAEVGHPVGLVHDEDLDRPQRQLASLEEVDEAPRRADHGVDALSEGGDLAVHRRAAVDGRDPYAAHLAQGREHVLDLVGELTGRRQHERPRRLRLRPPDSLEQWKAERERLPRPGLGLAAEVAAG